MCAWVLWKRDVIYLVGEEVRVARCVHGCCKMEWRGCDIFSRGGG